MSGRSPRQAGNTMVAALIAALIVGAAMLGSSYMISDSLKAMRGSIDDMKVAFEKAAAPRPAAQAQAPRRGPDPEKRYTLDIKAAPVHGAKDAKVTIVEFSDFQCPFCSRVTPTLKQLLTDYPDTLRIAYKHLPLDFHAKAPAAHAAAEAAHRQGKFWEMYDKIFSNQQQMSPEKYEQYATELGLDVEQFKKDLASQAVKDRIEADKREAASLGVSGTPSFFVNGLYLSGALPAEQFKSVIDKELGKAAGG